MARDSELETAPVDSNGQSFNDYGYSDNPDTSLDARRQERAAMVPTWKRSTVTSPRETQEQNEGKDGEKERGNKTNNTPENVGFPARPTRRHAPKILDASTLQRKPYF